MPASDRIHATCIALAGKGVLLLGEPGSGKSDLALRFIDRGAKLVADDQVELELAAGKILASAPERLRGLLEVRGVGIMTLPFFPSVPVALAVQLNDRVAIERLPQPQFFGCLGVQVPLLSLHAFDASTDAKIRLFLHLRE